MEMVVTSLTRLLVCFYVRGIGDVFANFLPMDVTAHQYNIIRELDYHDR